MFENVFEKGVLKFSLEVARTIKPWFEFWGLGFGGFFRISIYSLRALLSSFICSLPCHILV